MAFDEKVRIIIEAVGTGKAAADIKSLDHAMDSSGKSATGWKKSLGDVGGFIGNNLPMLAAGGAAAIGAFAVKAVGAFQDTALSAGKLADSTGLSIEQASRWNEVAGDVGISTESLGTSFGFLLKSIGKNPEKFRELGITAGDSSTQIQQALDVLNRTPEGAERAALGAQLFGKSWANMSELIAQGGDQVAASLAAVSDAKIINDGELRKARDFRATMDTLNDVIEDLTLTFGQFVIDGIAPTLSALGEFGAKINSIGALAGGGGGLFAKVLGNIPVAGSLDGFNTALDGSADNVDRLKGAATAILPPLKALPFGLFDTESAAEKASRKLAELTETAKNVNQGIDSAGRAAAGFVGDMTEAELATAKTEAAQRGLASAAELLAEKQEKAAEKAQEHAAALENVNEAAGVMLGAFLTLPDAIDEQSAAFADLATAMGDLKKENTPAHLAKVEEAAKKLAAADTALAKAQAESNGKTFDQKDALDATNRSLLTQAANMQGPAKQAILDRIAALNGIPKTVLSDIKAKIDAGDIAGAEAALNRASRARDAAIRAEATNVGYTEQQLANLARNRFSTIHVTTRVTATGVGTGLAAGGRASGGPVEAGTPYMVGEQGKELLIPKTDGYIMNAADTARALSNGGGGSPVGRQGGGAVNVNVNVTSADPQAVVKALEQYVRTASNRRLRALVS